MFPFVASGPAESVHGTRFERKIVPLPFRAHLAPEPEGTARKQRNSDYIAEYRAITMPPYRRSRGVFADESHNEFVRIEPGKIGSPFSYRHKKLRHRNGILEAPFAIVVPPAERSDATFCLITVKVEGLEFEPPYLVHKLALLGRREHLLLIFKAVRRRE